MKLTKVSKSVLNSVPGYKRWAFNRATRMLQEGKDRLLARAETRLVINPQTQQLEPTYADSVQAVFAYYDRELDKQRRAFYEKSAPDFSVEAAGASRA